jgi:seryl-tRNA synthetase
MLDIKLIREDPKVIRKNIERRKNPNFLKMFDELVDIDKEWRGNLSKLNELREYRNKISVKIAESKKKGKTDKKLMEEAAKIPKSIKEKEEKNAELESKMKSLLLRLPNILHESVPDGKDSSENKIIRVHGEKPKFDFKPKDHLEILTQLGMIDQERGSKAAGHAFFYLKGDAVLLDIALQKFAIDFLCEKDFKIIGPPLMLNYEAASGAEDLTTFQDQIYKIESEDLFLIPTSEHPIAAMHMNEVIDMIDLPLKYAGVSPCFRKEVGAHGKYTRGLFRMHQFNKVEQFIFCNPEDSWDLFDELQENTEELYHRLGLHFRVVTLCSADTGIKSAKTNDIECWMADGNYREVTSNSNVTDYQTRRLNVKYREKKGQAPIGFVFTLNNTAIATSRIMVAIIEQFQQKDGRVKIPKELVPYMNGIEFLEK